MRPRAKNKLRLSEKGLPTLPSEQGKSQVTYWDDHTRGLGVVVGKIRRTFIVKARVNGKQRKIKIGVHGGDRGKHACSKLCKRGGCKWTLTIARQIADKLRGEMEKGIDPSAERKARSGSISLRRALAIHIQNRQNKRGRPSAIATIDREVNKYLSTWLDSPLIDIERSQCRARHLEIQKDSGPHIADRVMRHLRALWNTALRTVEDSDPLKSRSVPTDAVAWCARKGGTAKKRRREPVSWDALPSWYESVTATESVGDSCLLIIFLTGLRKMDAATMRWEHIDLKERTLHRPHPKGGEEHAFDVPLSRRAIKILKRRKGLNLEIFGDDHGWCFPVIADKSDADKSENRRCYHCPEMGLPPHKAGVIVHTSSPRVQVYKDGKKARDAVSPHRLRDTYITACAEVGGLSVYDIKALVNHSQPEGDVTAGYIKLSAEHLAKCQERVTKFLVNKAK